MKNGVRGLIDHRSVGTDFFPRNKSKEDYV